MLLLDDHPSIPGQCVAPASAEPIGALWICVVDWVESRCDGSMDRVQAV
jgi:hypothetical protein